MPLMIIHNEGIVSHVYFLHPFVCVSIVPSIPFSSPLAVSASAIRTIPPHVAASVTLPSVDQ